MFLRLLLLLALFLLPLALPAQEAAVVVDELCACLEAADRRTGRRYAAECLRRITNDHRRFLRRAYDLDSSREADRLTYVDRNYEALVARCPLLLTLRPSGERKRSWSDIDTTARRSVVRYGDGDKDAPLRAAQRIPGEAPTHTLLEGRLLSAARGGELLLETPRKRRLTVRVPVVLRRRLDFIAGRTYRLRCREVWSADGITYVLQGVEGER